MPNNFCRFLSNGYRFRSDGVSLKYSPCCWFSKELDLVNNPNFDEQKSEISKISDWVPECRSCKQIEDSGAYSNRSPRLRSFEEIPDDSIPDDVPGWIELSIDITCNAACIMCGPWHSTTWRKQEVKFNIKTVHDMPDIVNPMHWLAFIKKKFTLDHVRSISFLGGEPFESPIPLAILRMLKRQRGTLSDVTVHFQTNGSLIPSDELMSLAAECNRVKFNMSIDGVGDRFEYIRYPLRWERIEKTAEHVKGLKLRNIKFFVLATINPLNVYYYNELENWVRETFNDQDLISLKPNKSIGPIALSQTPTSLRDVVLKKFGSDHKVSKLMSNLEVSPINECIQRLDWLDSNRKTNWRTTFPEIADFLNNVK